MIMVLWLAGICGGAYNLVSNKSSTQIITVLSGHFQASVMIIHRIFLSRHVKDCCYTGYSEFEWNWKMWLFFCVKSR